jgi:hypothetical protein
MDAIKELLTPYINLYDFFLMDTNFLSETFAFEAIHGLLIVVGVSVLLMIYIYNKVIK